jgi:TRAP-type transport system small permease protein
MREKSIIEKISKPVLPMVLVILVAFMAIQVFTRYVLNDPTGWTDEASSIALVYLTFLGSAMVVKRKQAFRITFIRDKIKGTRGGIVIEKTIKLLEIAFLIIAILYSIPLMIQLWNQDTAALRIPKSWVALAVPLGLIGMLGRLLWEFKNFGREEED